MQHGVGLTGRLEVRKHFELALGIDALASVRAEHGEVSALVYTVPILLSANVHLRRPRVEGALGAVAELLVVLLDASSPSTAVRSDRFVAAAFGAQLAGRVRLASVLWLYLRGSVLGLVNGERYTVRGEPLFELARLQVTGEAGFGVALW